MSDGLPAVYSRWNRSREANSPAVTFFASNFMQTDLNDIRVFVDTARTGAFSITGRELGLPTSTISRSIVRLETSLKLSLFDRGAKGLTLTPAGQKYLATCKRVLHALRDGRTSLERHRANPAGRLRIACPPTLIQECLTPMLVEFMAAYPHLEVSIGPPPNAIDPEASNEVDILFTFSSPKDGQRKLRSYTASRRGLYASSAYIQRGGQLITPSDLLEHTCVGQDAWDLVKDDLRETPPVVFRLKTADLNLQLRFVKSGAGIGLLPYWMAAKVEESTSLIRVLSGWRSEPTTFCVLYKDSAITTPKLRVFLDAFDNFAACSLVHA